MWEYLLFLGLAAAPISEVRGAILYGLSMNFNPYFIFIAGVLANIAIIPVIFLGFKQARFRDTAYKLFGERMTQKLESSRDKFTKFKDFGLLAFVAVPLPVTGAWTGAFIAELLNINRKRAFLIISFGVLIAASLVFLGFGGTMLLIEKII